MHTTTALVTGSTSGIGLKIAETLAAQGSNVIINGFGDEQTVERLCASIRRNAGVQGAPFPGEQRPCAFLLDR